MPDFELRVASGATLVPWLDPPSPAGQPSRLAPYRGVPHTLYQGNVGKAVELHAVVDGVDAPLDAALGGRLFMGWLAEGPCPTPVGAFPGHSAAQRFTPVMQGHYTIGVQRLQGGTVLIHIDVGP